MRDERGIDPGNALFCAQWLASYDPQEVIDALVECHLPGRDMRDIAARLCAIGGGLMVRCQTGEAK
jgi:hypothetical protein